MKQIAISKDLTNSTENKIWISDEIERLKKKGWDVGKKVSRHKGKTRITLVRNIHE